MYSHPYLCYSFLLLIYLLLFYLFIFVKNTRTNVYMYLISLLMYRYVINDRDHTLRVKQVVVITKTLSALLIIIAALSISPFFWEVHGRTWHYRDGHNPCSCFIFSNNTWLWFYTTSCPLQQHQQQLDNLRRFAAIMYYIKYRSESCFIADRRDNYFYLMLYHSFMVCLSKFER